MAHTVLCNFDKQADKSNTKITFADQNCLKQKLKRICLSPTQVTAIDVTG